VTHAALLRSKLRLGKELIAARRFEEARSVYQQICAKQKNDADSWLTLGAINGMLRRHAEAAECCSKAVELKPRLTAAWYNLGVALRDSGQIEKSAAAFRKTLQLDPKHESAASSLGHVLAALHRYEEAEEVFRGALRYQAANAEFYAVYGSAMQTMGRLEAAINAYRKAIEMRHPDTPGVHENMAAALCLQGKYSESIEHIETALRIVPQSPRYYSSMLLTLHYLHDLDPDMILDRHRNWPGNGLRIASHAGPRHPTVRPERLRVGYVSSDLRKHSVAYFIEPLLAHHDPARFEVTCYFSHKDTDATTVRLRSLVHRWRDVAEFDDDQLLRTIMDDGIDVLVDLNGHTGGNRLPVFARRAAPVQVSFIGYPDTTGVAEMDFRITDGIADPAGSERYCTESLVRLPGCFLCYRPPEQAPAVAPPPFEKNGFITFGSFNNLAKINPEVIALWSRLLRETGDSRLIVKNPSLTDKATQERFRALFAEQGISTERLALLGYIPDDGGHLGAYARIDIALDTFPYNGTTTTCEALWMGVPLVSLSGDRHSARVGASLLAATESTEWVADTEERYLAVARELSQNRERLVELRSRLRERVWHSPLCAAADYARVVELAYDDMYRARVVNS
jgi:predicted O-linked N-acetylglucosamine transferase (SPINDLY family)